MSSPRNRRPQILIIAAALGALVGLAAGYTILKRAEEHDGPAITARESLSLGMLVVGLLRQVAQLGDGE